jgi:hypothetical protein
MATEKLIIRSSCDSVIMIISDLGKENEKIEKIKRNRKKGDGAVLPFSN